MTFSPNGDAYQIRGPFGYFVGEYEGLSSAGNIFRPLFAVGTGDPANRTDIVTATAS